MKACLRASGRVNHDLFAANRTTVPIYEWIPPVLTRCYAVILCGILWWLMSKSPSMGWISSPNLGYSWTAGNPGFYMASHRCLHQTRQHARQSPVWRPSLAARLQTISWRNSPTSQNQQESTRGTTQHRTSHQDNSSSPVTCRPR